MDKEFERQMQEVLDGVKTAEVVCIIFPHLSQCLVFDGRYTPEEPPRLAVSPPLGSIQRRLRQLNQARPYLPKVTQLTTIPWTEPVASLVRSGIWERLMARMIDSGFTSAVASCQAVLDELRAWEYRANVAMIRGHGPYHTIWSRVGERS